MTIKYAIRLTRYQSVYLVSCRDLHGMNTEGDSIEEALANAAEAMFLVLQHRFDESLPLPESTGKQDGEHWVELSEGVFEAARVRNFAKNASRLSPSQPFGG